MVDFLLNNYHVGLESCARRLGISEKEVLEIAPKRIKEYWELQDKTSGYDTLISRFSALCKELNLTEVSALTTLNRRFKK